MRPLCSCGLCAVCRWRHGGWVDVARKKCGWGEDAVSIRGGGGTEEGMLATREYMMSYNVFMEDACTGSNAHVQQLCIIWCSLISCIFWSVWFFPFCWVWCWSTQHGFGVVMEGMTGNSVAYETQMRRRSMTDIVCMRVPVSDALCVLEFACVW